jgi:adenine C2-methylase RlmN of 23S rRNA A2503 and tRNA A37
MRIKDTLMRISKTCKTVIAPSTQDEYAKTQAYMASVVLEKIALQIALEEKHDLEMASAYQALVDEVSLILNNRKYSKNLSSEIHNGLENFSRNKSRSGLDIFVKQLYLSKEALGEELVNKIKERVHVTMRADIDFRMEFAK